MVDAYAMSPTPHPGRDELILEHIPLLKHISGRMTFDLPGGMDRDDLYGFGMLGLISAADSWDANRGLKFSTYAYPRIRGAILDALRRSDFLPRGRREKVRKVDLAVAKIEQEKGSPPSPEELSELLNIPIAELDEIIVSASNAMEATLDDGPGEALASLLRDPHSPDPVDSAEWNELKDLVVELIQALPEQEQTVITLYYAEELLLREIATIMDLTESRVSQVHSRAIYRLNAEICARTGADPNSEEGVS